MTKFDGMDPFADDEKISKNGMKTALRDIQSYFPTMTPQAQDALALISSEWQTNDIIQMLGSRMDPKKALLVGAYLNPLARKVMDEALDFAWSKEQAKVVGGRDVIIGGGLHAAIYAAIAFEKTGVKPLVIERSSRVGGAFAVTSNPAFYLNSRNRPGPLGLPGVQDRPGSLNVIPGAPVQPSDLSGDEYADNATLGWAIRMSLAMYADVVSDLTVTDILGDGVQVENDLFIPANRVIVATGLGRQSRFTAQSDRVMSYFDFMRQFDSPFPLQGMDRVAVVGSGDSGKTVIEALTGQGPARSGYSMASLDYPKDIVWFGVGKDEDTCRSWARENRSRYAGIGRNLPRERAQSIDEDGDPLGPRFYSASRVIPVAERIQDISAGWDEVMVNGRPFDTVIICTGFEEDYTIRTINESMYTPGYPSGLKGNDLSANIEMAGGMSVARRFSNGGVPYYLIGPCAELPLSQMENDALPPGARSLMENTVAIFRYARKTATLARTIN